MYGISITFSRVVSLSSVRYKSGSTEKLLEFLANMPKANTGRIVEAQRQRQNISKKSEKYGPSTVYLQVLGSGARGAPNTLYLFTDNKRYLFNCGECTQRLAHEHRVKLSKLDHIFITNKTWRNIGGLPGLSLTLQDVGVPNITLHGPKGLDELYNATRRFVIMKEMNVSMAKCSSSEDFEDSVMTVKYVLLYPHDNLLAKDLKSPKKISKDDTDSDKEFEQFIHDDTDYYTHNTRNKQRANNYKSKQQLQENDNYKKKTEKMLQEMTQQKDTPCTVAYICTLKKRLGSLVLEKCVELGVKPGPLLGQLKSGQDVVLEDGTLVRSKDVKTPDDPGPVFIVLDLPDISYLKEDEFSAHFDNEANPKESVPALIVHYTPPHVFLTPAYKSFMEKFGPSTRHLILNSQNSCLGSEAVHRTQHKLHLLDPDIFPLLRDVSVPAVWNATMPAPKPDSPIKLKGLEELKNKIALAQFQNIIRLEGSGEDGLATNENELSAKLELMAGRTLTIFHLRPKKELDRSAEPKLHIQDYIQESMNVDGFVDSLDQFRHLVDGMRYAKDANEFPKVVFLGTGSCIPSKTRNTSAIVVQIDENRSILLDCGEGTFGQLVRFYGPKKVNAFLRTLKAIYISHLHADHHIGLIGVIQAHREAHEELIEPVHPLYLLAPGQIMSWLSMYDKQFEAIKTDFTLIPNQHLLVNNTEDNTSLTSAVLASIGAQAIQTCQVAHCPNAFGVAIQLNGDYKVTYSGDTLPCEELVKIGANSTLLIHEATMEDELAEEARIKMHSTTSQAINIGRQMDAKYTVLTHFSQRYARLPRLNAHILNENKNIGIAFDNMQITMSDLQLLPHMYAPLQLMFAEHCVEMELKAQQRLRLKERRGSTDNSGTPKRSRNHSVQKQERKYSTDARAQGEGPEDSRGQLVHGRHKTGSDSIHAKLSHSANYWESNASRLRQESKGMVVSGMVRDPHSRSPVPNSPHISPSRTYNTSKSSPLRFRKESPERRRRPVPSKTSSICPTLTSKKETEGSKNLEGKRQQSPDKLKDCLNRKNESPPRLRTSEKLAISSNGRTKTTGYIANTHSKTLDSIPDKDPVKQIMNSVITTKHNFDTESLKSTTSPNRKVGYGKPIVTPLNKKLTIRREPPWSSSLPRSPDRSPPPVYYGCTCPSPKHSHRYANRPHSPTKYDLSPSRQTKSMDIPENKNGSKAPHPSLQSIMKTSTQSLSKPKDVAYVYSMNKESFPSRNRMSSNGHLSRRFKPQLEDIKNSNLLMNKNINRSMEPDANGSNVTICVSSSFNEIDRKRQLKEVKRKFQSRKFQADSKYEKIEGLNWISWK